MELEYEKSTHMVVFCARLIFSYYASTSREATANQKHHDTVFDLVSLAVCESPYLLNVKVQDVKSGFSLARS